MDILFPLVASILAVLNTLIVNPAAPASEFPIFDEYFERATLRIDYLHEGDAQSEKVILDGLYNYPHWAGSLVNLVDTLDYGTYCHRILDSESGKVIYSRGFDSYFKEYQTSTPAREGQVKTFHESAIIPFPKAVIEFGLLKRNKDGEMVTVFATTIDPDGGLVSPGPMDPSVIVYDSQISGDPGKKADVAIIGEGYTKREKEKFERDLERFTQIFFHAEPCRSRRSNFNIRGVLKFSEESGADEPRANIYRNTAVGASFNSMGSERYLLTEDNKALRDIAGHAPYDALYIMVNHTRYGGGGIYNFYCVYTSDNINSDYLMVHEFGHSFFGLADEYYTSSTAYNDFYSPENEPPEPNITALQDPDNIKWKHLLTPGVPIPTPWAKQKYDSLDLEWQAERARLNEEIAELQRKKVDPAFIEMKKAEYNKKSKARDSMAQAYLESSPYNGQVGAFEGAGYLQYGLYRPSINCIMFTRTDYFCPVCRDAMTGVIDWYSN